MKPNTRKVVPIGVEVGERVEYIGATITSDTKGSQIAGDIGVVLRVRPPLEGTGRLLVDDSIDGKVYDEGEDGYAVVQWPNWSEPRLLRVAHDYGDGKKTKNWRKVSK